MITQTQMPEKCSMKRGCWFAAIAAVALCLAPQANAEPTEYINVMYSLAEPMETNAIGLQIGAGWTWAGMHYGSEGNERDTSFLGQWGLARSFGDQLGVLAGISLGINRNCSESTEKALNLDRAVCVNEGAASARTMSGTGGYNIGLIYQITDSIGATLMYDTFNNKPNGADGLQGLIQFGVNWHP